MLTSGKIAFGAMEGVVFGKPAAAMVVEQADRLAAKRVFLLVSHTLNTKTDEIEKVRRALGSRYAGTFDAIPPHTPRGAVIAASEQARALQADLIVTIGGGSVIDAGKAIQLCLANDIRTADAMDALRVVKGVAPNLKSPKVRQISVPTALSAGEFSTLVGVTDERTKSKDMFRHVYVIPRIVILDPAITLHTPEWLWMSTGVRAIDHCVEGLCSNESQLYADAQALKGLALLTHALARVKANPKDFAARLDCQMGAWLSMGPLSTGVPMGASHGIGYVLGAMHGVPHGYTSCIMLPAVMRWNESANADRQSLVATAMSQAGKNPAEVLSGFIGGLGMPRRLSDAKINAAMFPTIAEKSMATPWVPRNPKPIAGPGQVMEILKLAA